MSRLSDWYNDTFHPGRREFRAAVDDVMDSLIERIKAGEDISMVIARYIEKNEPPVWWHQTDQTWCFSEPFGSYYGTPDGADKAMPVGKEVIFESGRGGRENDVAIITGHDWDEHHNIYYLNFPEEGVTS